MLIFGGNMQKASTKAYMIGAICVVLSSIMFSAKAVLIKKAFMASDITPIVLMMMRMVCSVPLLWAIVGIEKLIQSGKKQSSLGARDWFDIIVVGTCGYYLASLFDFMGLIYISVGLERIILYLYPTFVVVIGAVFLKTGLSRRIIVPLIICYAGVFMAFAGEITERGFQNIKGMLFVVLSAFLFSIFVVTSGRVIKKIVGARFSAYAMTVSTLAIVIHYFATHSADAVTHYIDVLPLAIFIAVFATVLPVNLMTAGLVRVGPNHFAVLSCVGPMATMVMGWLFLGENPGNMEWAGLCTVVVGGIMLGIYKGRSVPKRKLV
jgi:drug/metabolite transporter (DMT)-like permease